MLSNVPTVFFIPRDFNTTERHRIHSNFEYQVSRYWGSLIAKWIPSDHRIIAFLYTADQSRARGKFTVVLTATQERTKLRVPFLNPDLDPPCLSIQKSLIPIKSGLGHYSDPSSIGPPR